MLPTLGRIGPVVLHTYTVLIDVGILAALGWLWWRAPQRGAEPNRWLHAGLGALAGGLVGARLAYVTANWAFYSNHLGEALAIWTGGLAAPGALVGAALGLGWTCARKGEPFGPLIDELALPALLLSALGWAGCAAAGCAAGHAVAPGELAFAVDWPDLYGITGLRWPTQVVGVGASVLALIVIALVRTRAWVPGVLGFLGAGLIAALGFGLSWVRGDEMPLVRGIRLDAIAYAITALLALVGLAARWALQPAPANDEVTHEQAT